jgi:hypothetical protein
MLNDNYETKDEILEPDEIVVKSGTFDSALTTLGAGGGLDI